MSLGFGMTSDERENCNFSNNIGNHTHTYTLHKFQVLRSIRTNCLRVLGCNCFINLQLDTFTQI